MAEQEEVKSKAGRTSLPDVIIEQRREYEVMLKQAGMSTATIMKQVNSEAKARGWLPVSARTIALDIADYYRKNRVLKVDDYDHAEQMRESLMDSLEINMEKMAILINTKDRSKTVYDINQKPIKIGGWKAFEKADALEKLHKMQMNYAELQNWNYGRPNFTVNIQQNNLNMVYDDAAQELQKQPPETITNFIEHIDNLADVMEEEERKSREAIEVVAPPIQS